MSDLISREAAIDAFYIQSDDDGWWVGTAQDAETLLNGLPTIDPVKHGRWEKLDLWTKPVCSVCGEPCFGLHGFSYETTTYCPNCGAKMDEVTE